MPRKKASGIDVHIGKRLKVLRAMRGLSQIDIADMMDITFQQYQKYETGKNKISAAHVYTLIIKLDVPCQYFFDFRDGTQDMQSLYLNEEINTIVKDNSSPNIDDENMKRFPKTIKKWNKDKTEQKVYVRIDN